MFFSLMNTNATTGTTAATTAASVGETVGKSLEVTWQGMLAICVVIAICIVTTKIITAVDRKMQERKKKNEENTPEA